jgi:hypothetical protein
MDLDPIALRIGEGQRWRMLSCWPSRLRADPNAVQTGDHLLELLGFADLETKVVDARLALAQLKDVIPPAPTQPKPTLTSFV